jgi:hypothetical protein
MPFNSCGIQASFRHPFLIRKHYTLVNLLDQLFAGVQNQTETGGLQTRRHDGTCYGMGLVICWNWMARNLTPPSQRAGFE